MEKKKLSDWQNLFFSEAGFHELKRMWILDYDYAIYGIIYKLQIATYIVLITHIIGCVAGVILSFYVSNGVLFIYAVVEGSVFAAMLLADIVVSIVTLRKAFKSCSKE